MKSQRSLLARLAIWMTGLLLLSTVIVGLVAARYTGEALLGLSQEDMNLVYQGAETLLRRYHRGEYTAPQVQALLNPEFTPSSWLVRLVDSQDQIIAQTHGAQAFFDESLSKHMSSGANLPFKEWFGFVSGSALGNIYVFPLSEEGTPLGQVVLGKRMTVLENTSKAVSLRVLLLMSGLFLLLLMFLAAAGRWLILPIYRLIGASRAVAARDFSVKADERAQGEIGQLARTFNRMAEELEIAIEALEVEKTSMVQVLEGLSEGILALDSAGTIIHRNHMFDRLLGSAGTALEAEIRSLIKQVLQDGREQRTTSWLGDVCVEVIVSPLLAGSDNPPSQVGAVALARDVTAQQRLEQTRHDYVANISHELRTPLATMRGLLEPLRDGLVESPADRQRYYNIVLGEILRLSRLVSDLLELSGLQSGRASFELERVDAQQLLLEIQERFEKAFQKKGVDWQVDGTGALPVWANEDRLAQVLTILTDNALKYTPPGGQVHLVVTPGLDCLRFAISDTGPGIASDQLPHIFDRFYQTDRSHSDQGNGLGLSIAQEIMEKMGMKLAAQSVLGSGTLFSFEVPFAR